MLAEPTAKKLTMANIVAKGSLIAIIIAVPTLIVFFVIWTVFDDLIFGAVGGLITNFIALGISFKIVSKKFIKKPKDDFEL
jgi:uncharacterized membrane protein YgaE (UPF0421/DUF939 family)|tara:strand:- start:607 stop:849 length:243 start_codon:yes stop_codon:yes gene_type:complete